MHHGLVIEVTEPRGGLELFRDISTDGGGVAMVINECHGSRVREAGFKQVGEELTFPEGAFGLWIIDGEAEWPGARGETVTLGAADTVYRLAGTGRVVWCGPGRYICFDEWDALGFGSRASSYRALIEAHNRDVGRVLAQGLPLEPGQT